MRRRTTLFALLVSAVLLIAAGASADGPARADHARGGDSAGGGPEVLAQQSQTRDQDRRMDGDCVALDPQQVRARFREEFCALFCLDTVPADAEVDEVTRILRRAPLSAREAAVDELLFDVAIRDTAAAADAIADIAERHGLPEDALREAVALARERLLTRLREEGELDAANEACLMQRVRSEFRIEGEQRAP